MTSKGTNTGKITKGPSALRNVVSNWSASITSLAIAFLLSPFVVHHLGTAAYGVWILVMSLTGYLGLLDLGVRGTVTCYIAKFHTEGKHEEASRLASSALTIFTLLGTIAFGVSVLIALLAPHLFHLSERTRPSLTAVLVIAGATMGVTLVSNVYGAVVIGLQRFELANAVEVGTALVRSATIVIALRWGHGLLSLAIIQLGCAVAMGLVFVWVSWRLYPQLSVRYFLADWKNARLMVSFGGYLFLLNVSAYLILYSDSIVVGSFLPIAMVTYFAIGGNLVSSARSFVSGISTTLSPLASALNAEGDRSAIEKIGLAGPRYATMLVLPVVITFALRGKTFIGLWMGKEYADLSSKVLTALSLSLLFAAANQVATSTMLGLNKHRPLVLVTITEGAINLVLSIALVTRMGVLGVALGTAIPTVFTSLVFWPLYIRHVFGVRPVQYIGATWLRPLVAAIPFAVITLFMDRLWPAPNVWFFFLQVGLVLPSILVTFWFGCMSRSERQSCLGQILPLSMGFEEIS